VIDVASDIDSARVAQARVRAEKRLRSQRDTLRPLGTALIAVVLIGTLNAHPAPSGHGSGLGVAIALAVFAGSLVLAIRPGFERAPIRLKTAAIVAMGAAGVALAALQPRGAAGLATGAAVWMAVAGLPQRLGVGLAAAMTAALVLASALAGSSGSTIAASALLCALMGLIAHFLHQSRDSQARTELLMAQLEDAREEQTRAAAIAERGRIAGELHDVLAHSLSGAAIQLQGARLLAEREQAPDRLRQAIDRAGELVRDGLADAREAVGALRGERLPGMDELPGLVESFSSDMGVPVTLSVEGTARKLPADAGLALYRGVQEALTNVARYAPGASTRVVLSYLPGRTTLTVEDRVVETVPAAGGGLKGVGGGRGLGGMQERLERAGGRMQAGPTDLGWRVELEVPA
jgi:signal transduction histidine kinase